MSIIYCRVAGKAVNGTLIIKKDAEYGNAYMNIKDKKGKFYQIHGKEYKEEIIGANGLVHLNSIGGPNDVSYTINRFTKKVVFLGEFDSQGIFMERTENIKECNFGSNKMKELPEPYSPSESAILVGIGIFLVLCLYIFLRKYFLELWKRILKKK